MKTTNGTRTWRTSSVGEGTRSTRVPASMLNILFAPFIACVRQRRSFGTAHILNYYKLLQVFNNDFLVNSFIITNFAAEVYYHSYSL